MSDKDKLKEKKDEDLEPQEESESKESSVSDERREIEELRKQLEEEKAKNKYEPELIPIPDEQKDLPEGVQDAQIKTTVKDMSKVIKEKMDQLKDMATMEVLLDTPVRMKNRLESIRKMTSAKHYKIRGQWKTEPPKMHIAKLQGKKINNDECEITFGVFETDEKGDKKLYTQYVDVLLHDGSTIKRATSAEYRIAYEVTERIKTGKPITREVIRLNRVKR